MLRPLAFEERFIVADKNGEVLAAVRYRTERNRLLLGLLVADPWVDERRLAAALYARAAELAREMGAEEVFARLPQQGDYPHDAGYQRTLGSWRLNMTRSLYRREELPTHGWRRVLTLWGVFAIPFFNLGVHGSRGR